ncbi:MAG: hypothetical protein IJ737_07260 [Ruminococcus sp.]|nr:hypothetical protein [Ruminococcus sp.]
MNAFRMIMLADSALPFHGVLNSWRGPVGIVLIVLGICAIYMGIKVRNGYELMPPKTQNIPKEDTYVPAKAKVLQRKKTTMPSFSGDGDTVIVEWKIGYEVNGEKITQMIPDGDYEKGDMLDIKYDPDDPTRYYLDNGTETGGADEEEEEEEDISPDKNPLGTFVLVIGFVFILVGIMIML